MDRNTIRRTLLVLGILIAVCGTIIPFYIKFKTSPISKLAPIKASTSTRPRGYTILKRSLVAFKKDNNGVHLSWRLFQEDLDANFKGFKVFRQSADITANCQNQNGYVTATTACDDQPGVGTFTYYVQAFDANGGLLDTSNSVMIETNSTGQNYLALNLGGVVMNNTSVTLNGKYKVGNSTGKAPMVTVGDLEGNGAMGFVVTFEPQANDPGAGRYYIQAFKSDGSRYWGPMDIGPAAPDANQSGAPLVTGIGWHNPVLIWDIMGTETCSGRQGSPGGTPDGCAEVIVRTSTDIWGNYSNENLTVINGQTGSVISQVRFPSGAAPGDNFVSEREGNQLAIAYLDGMSNPSTATPYVFISRGLHDDTHTYVYEWNSATGNLASVNDRYLCGTPGTSHNIAIGDTDLGCTGGAGCDNNNDKIIFRETCLSGTTLANCANWTNLQRPTCAGQTAATVTRQLGETEAGYYSMHSHAAILADIDPSRAGLELLIGTHRVGPQFCIDPYAALYLTDAQTGNTTFWSKSSEPYPAVTCTDGSCCNDGSLACSTVFGAVGLFLFDQQPAGMQISAPDSAGRTDTTYLWSVTGTQTCPSLGIAIEHPLNWDSNSSGISYWYTTTPPDKVSPGVFKLTNCTTQTRVATFGTCNDKQLAYCARWTADIFGDAAEEVVMAPGGTNTSIQIFTNTTSPSTSPRPRKRTPLQDRKYRLDLTRTGSADFWPIHESGQTISAKQ